MPQHAAQDLSSAALGGPILISGDGRFTDSLDRTLSLRGFNVSGASKLPTSPNGLSHLSDGFYDNHRGVTFTGRPFPLEDAPLHFRRLRAWGLPVVRLLVTWESLGHAGPDPRTDVDSEYVTYLRQLVEMMPRYGIRCFVCAHQDVWSRFSGGSGAPGWTFEAAGLDIEAFTDTGAAYVHSQDEKRRAGRPVNEREVSGPFVWPSGYQKLAASTMATLFWAGDALAPKLKCRRPQDSSREEDEDEVSIQTFLQDAYIEAFGRLADELSGLEGCIGFEPMNEPHRGLVELHNIHYWNYNTDLHIGHYPSFAQSLALGSGYAQEVNYYVKSWPFPTRITHRSLLDPGGRSAWLPAGSAAAAQYPYSGGMGQCVWKAHGVWEWDEKKKVPRILQEDYFRVDHRPGREGKPIEWYRDCYTPFLQRFCERMARKNPSFLSFFEPIPNEFLPPWPETEEEEERTRRKKQSYAVKTVMPAGQPHHPVYAPHFYDLNVLFSKQHGWMSVNVQGLSRGMFVLAALYFGPAGLRRNYRKQLGNIVRYGRRSLGDHVPTVIGEVGIPFDVNGGAAFRTGHYDAQRELMNALIAGMEDNHVGFTLWNYNPNNKVEYGDGWNMEDFSVINGDEVGAAGELVHLDYQNRHHEHDELFRGGRVLDVIIRPYAVKIAGRPLRSDWDYRTLKYELEWEASSPSGKSNLTEIYIPSYHYAKHKLIVTTGAGVTWTYSTPQQTLHVRHDQTEPTSRRRLVVEIADLRKHLAQRVVRRREREGREFSVLDYVPVDVEVWLEGLAWGVIGPLFLFLLVASAVAALAVYLST